MLEFTLTTIPINTFQDEIELIVRTRWRKRNEQIEAFLRQHQDKVGNHQLAFWRHAPEFIALIPRDYFESHAKLSVDDAKQFPHFTIQDSA